MCATGQRPSQVLGSHNPWQRVRETLGLPDDVVPYSFRKLIAMILDNEGLWGRVTADVLQHADPAMTQRKYMARARVHHGSSGRPRCSNGWLGNAGAGRRCNRT